jgi:hypothetical protein
MKLVSSWLCFFRNYVTMMHSQKNIKLNVVTLWVTVIPCSVGRARAKLAWEIGIGM